MSLMRQNHHEALGLFGCGDRWHLVKVERESMGYRVTNSLTTQRHENAPVSGEVGRLLSGLPNGDRDLPICVVLPDHAGLYRQIKAPQAADEVVDKIVAAQVETMLPGQGEGLRWGWSRAGRSQDLWVHAVAQRDIDKALAVLPGGFEAAWAVSDTMALARLALTTTSLTTTGPVALVAIGETRTALIAVNQGRLTGVSVLDAGYAKAAGSKLQNESWIEELRDAWDGLLNEVKQDDRPGRCLLSCPLGDDPGLAEAVNQATDLPIQPFEDQGDIYGVRAADVPALIAASAAAVCFDPVTPAVRLSAGHDRSPLMASMKRNLVIAGSWLVVALLCLCLLDHYRAGRISAVLSTGPLSSESLAELDRQIAIARYLETSGPIPLAILDEIGQVTQTVMLDELTYQRGGELQISGMCESGDEISTLTASLAKAQTLSAVSLQSQNQADKKVRYEIVATPSSRFFGAFVEPAKPKQEAQEDGPENTGDGD